MPIYEYKCKACGREFEYQQRMSDPDKTDCEACGQSALERLISLTAFQLKGGGWYRDLYASQKPESKWSDSSKSEGSSSGSSEGSSTSGDKSAGSSASGSSGSGSSGSGS